MCCQQFAVLRALHARARPEFSVISLAFGVYIVQLRCSGSIVLRCRSYHIVDYTFPARAGFALIEMSGGAAAVTDSLSQLKARLDPTLTTISAHANLLTN